MDWQIIQQILNHLLVVWKDYHQESQYRRQILPALWAVRCAKQSCLPSANGTWFHPYDLPNGYWYELKKIQSYILVLIELTRNVDYKTTIRVRTKWNQTALNKTEPLYAQLGLVSVPAKFLQLITLRGHVTACICIIHMHSAPVMFSYTVRRTMLNGQQILLNYI